MGRGFGGGGRGGVGLGDDNSCVDDRGVVSSYVRLTGWVEAHRGVLEWVPQATSKRKQDRGEPRSRALILLKFENASHIILMHLSFSTKLVMHSVVKVLQVARERKTRNCKGKNVKVEYISDSCLETDFLSVVLRIDIPIKTLHVCFLRTDAS